jgi:hypothetical protein
MYIYFYGIKIKMIFLMVFNNEKMFVQIFGNCIFKVGLLKWLMEIQKNKLDYQINDNKMYL